jgi:hypothetical protein
MARSLVLTRPQEIAKSVGVSVPKLYRALNLSFAGQPITIALAHHLRLPQRAIVLPFIGLVEIIKR